MSRKTDMWWETTIVANPFLWQETCMGIDWGETDNAYAVTSYRGTVLAQGKVHETPKGLEEILGILRRFAHPTTGEMPPVGIETPRRLLVAELSAAGVRIVPLNPKTVKVARGETKTRNASKTDALDAVLIANMLRKSPDAYPSLHAATDQARAITLLYRTQIEAVRSAVRQAARVRSTLSEYHPNATKAFTATQMAQDLSAYWVLVDALTPAEGARLRRSGIRARMLKPGARTQTEGDKLDAAVERVYIALHQPYLKYPDQFEAAFAETVRTDLEVLRAAVLHKTTVTQRLEDALKAHPMWTLLIPAKGAGPGAIGGLIAEMGDDPHRFASHNSLQAFAGSAPAVAQSGGSLRVTRREVKGNRLHQAMYHWAESAAVHQPAACVYYWDRRAKGQAHPHVIRKIINKLLRGVHSCVTHGHVWDDAAIWDATVTKEQAAARKTEARELLAARRSGRQSVVGL